MAQARFPATARLHNSGDFDAVFAHGYKFVCPGFVLIAAATEGDQARLGLALAKRRIARAVDRNRIKRVVRESFRRHRHALGATDVVALARSRTSAMSNADLFAQLADAWPRIGPLDTSPPPDAPSPARAG